MGISKDEYTWTTMFDEEEVDKYLSSLQNNLKRKPTLPQEQSSKVAKGSDPPAKPADVSSNRFASLFGSPHEPTPVVSQKRHCVVIEPSESYADKQAGAAGSGI
ncbi:hypothetical protein H1R20_g7984, partial [Candolleomyces eurysporus]